MSKPHNNIEELQASVVSNVWGHSDMALQVKRAAMSMLATKHGLYTKIPISCKGDECPYRRTCPALKHGAAPEGEICPIEAALIEQKYEGYNSDFNLDEASFTDRSIVSEIINLDIQLERCKELMGAEGVPVVDVVAGVDESGTPIYRPEVSKFQEAYERALEKRNKLYSLMEATRKDRKQETQEVQSIDAVIAAALTKQANDEFIIDERPDNI